MISALYPITAALHVTDNQLIYLPFKKYYSVTTPLNWQQNQIFGDITESWRLQLFSIKKSMNWRGILIDRGASLKNINKCKDATEAGMYCASLTPAGAKIQLLDGSSLSLVEIGGNPVKVVIERSIGWDRIKPPRDRGGEPTTLETQQLRARFKQNFDRTKGTKFTGVAFMGETAKENRYFLASRVPSFPLTVLDCDKKMSGDCVVSRACYVENLLGLESEQITGIGYSEKSKLVAFGDNKNQKIHLFKYSSCMHVEKIGLLTLPKKIKRLTNLTIDKRNNLWVSTENHDGSTRASIYFWKESEWAPK